MKMRKKLVKTKGLLMEFHFDEEVPSLIMLARKQSIHSFKATIPRKSSEIIQGPDCALSLTTVKELS